MNRDEIIDAIARGELSHEDALAKLVADGMSQDDASYMINSLATVDVIP